VKHTYLYPLKDGELPLWRMARTGAADLFDSPQEEPPSVMWEHYMRLSDALGAARDELHKRLESRDRICIGRHYMIPGSLCEVAQSHERDADQVVRYVTRDLWDAPLFYGITWANVVGTLQRAAGQDGRDEWAEIQGFCAVNRMSKDNGKGIRVVPVWM
jgi:hypothetical protein